MVWFTNSIVKNRKALGWGRNKALPSVWMCFIRIDWSSLHNFWKKLLIVRSVLGVETGWCYREIPCLSLSLCVHVMTLYGDLPSLEGSPHYVAACAHPQLLLCTRAAWGLQRKGFGVTISSCLFRQYRPRWLKRANTHSFKMKSLANAKLPK